MEKRMKCRIEKMRITKRVSYHATLVCTPIDIDFVDFTTAIKLAIKMLPDELFEGLGEKYIGLLPISCEKRDESIVIKIEVYDKNYGDVEGWSGDVEIRAYKSDGSAVVEYKLSLDGSIGSVVDGAKEKMLAAIDEAILKCH